MEKNEEKLTTEKEIPKKEASLVELNKTIDKTEKIHQKQIKEINVEKVKLKGIKISANSLKTEIGRLEEEQKRILEYIVKKNKDLDLVNNEISSKTMGLNRLKENIRETQNKCSESQIELNSILEVITEKSKKIESDISRARKVREFYIEAVRDGKSELLKMSENNSRESKKLNGKISDLESSVERLGNEISYKKKTLTELSKDIKINLKEIKSSEATLKRLNSNIESRHLDLGKLSTEVKSVNEKIKEDASRGKKLERETEVLVKENKKEKEALDKLIKKRIRAGEQKEVLTQLQEEIRHAYERAGMPYPYE